MDLTQPEYAYMFGFLQADGHLAAGRGEKGHLSVEVSAVDREILLRFQDLCPYPSSVRDRTRDTNFKKNHTSSTWTMCSFEGRTLVWALGLPYGKKSETIRPPVVDFSERDYVRGLVDADGSVGFTRTGAPFISLTTSSDAIAEYFSEFCRSINGRTRNPRRNSRDQVFNITYFNEAATSVAAHVYHEGALALSRKADKASTLRSWERQPRPAVTRQPRRRWTAEEDATVVAHQPRVAAPLLNRSVASCRVRRAVLKRRAEVTDAD